MLHLPVLSGPTIRASSSLSTPSSRRIGASVRCFSWWDPEHNRKTGRPAISKSEDLFVSKDIPVVLLKDVPKLGVRGPMVFGFFTPQIVHVRRGYARSLLVPSGVAVYGTLWENIDRYADPDVLGAAEATAKMIEAEKEAHPFDWVGEY
eukprot:g8459.t1